MAGRADQTLLDELAAGKEEAFGKLYDLYAQRLFRTAFRILGRREEAEDAVQDVFLALVRAGRTLAHVEDLNAYLFASLRRAAARRAERGLAPIPGRFEIGSLSSLASGNAAAPAAEGAGLGPGGEADVGEKLERVLRALPVEQREVLALKIDGGLTFEEIAEALNVKANTAASRYRYALERLRAALARSSHR